MVGTDGTVEADIVESLHDLVHIERTVSGKVSGFLEVGGRMELEVTNVSEVNSALERTDHVGKIVLENVIPARVDVMDTETLFLPINLTAPDSDACEAFRDVISELRERSIL